MEPANKYIFFLFVAVFIVLCFFLYRKIPFRRFTSKRPFLIFFPKYLLKNIKVNSVDTPLGKLEHITSKLTEISFELKTNSPSKLFFSRGHFLGDFSTDIAKLDVYVDTDNHGELNISIEYGQFALFDTGDLWKITKKIHDLIEE